MLYLFYKFEIGSGLDKNDFKYINLNNIKQENDKYLFELDNHKINIQGKNNENRIILIDNIYRLNIKDMLSFMWIMFKICNID